MIDEARCVVLVEGVSDQIALAALAERQGRDLDAERVAIVPMGGAHAITRHLREFGPSGVDLPLAGLCDEAEEHYFRQALAEAGLGSVADRHEMEQLGFYVCVTDLESELIAAAGQDTIESLLDQHGDLGAFRTLQRQAEWRDAGFEAQMHRWLRAGSRRNKRYARHLVLAVAADQIPHPLTGVLRSAT